MTSAESVLITEQSQDQLLRVLSAKSSTSPPPVIVVTVSPQSRASLAARYGIEDAAEAGERLAGYLKRHLGVDFVFDETFGRELSLLESAREFVDRYRRSTAEAENDAGVEAAANTVVGDAPLPMLASSCPGWICYAEKTHGSFILPYISVVKSPQQILGSLVKDRMATLLQKRRDQIYHVTVAPCFDKKLEASRTDFTDQASDNRDVDCVLTSLELESMLMTGVAPASSASSITDPDGLSLADFPRVSLDSVVLLGRPQTGYFNHRGGGSGGFADFIFRYAAATLFPEIPLGESDDVDFAPLRNADMREATLVDKDGRVRLKFALAYGFRNIQNLVQKMKRGSKKGGAGGYHFVEVMACPGGGCLNGGGQIKDAGANQSKDRLEAVTRIYESVPTRAPRKQGEVAEIYAEWLKDDSDTVKRLLHTEYHEVEKNVTSLNIKW